MTPARFTFTGVTSSANLPLTPGAFQPAWPPECGAASPSGFYDCQQGFVTKLDAGLKNIIYSTLLGQEQPVAIAIDKDGGAYVAGTVTGTVQDAPAARIPFEAGFGFGGPSSIIVSRLDATGSSLVASRYLAGNYSEFPSSIELDPSGNVIVAGETGSLDFPSTGASTARCGPDLYQGFFPALFVTKLDPMLNEVLSSARIPKQSAHGITKVQQDGTLYAAAGPDAPTTLFSRVPNPSRIFRVSLDAPSLPSAVRCVVSSASFLAEVQIVGGELLTIYDDGLGPDAPLAFDSSQQLPTEAAGTEVYVNGSAAPLLFVSSNQINFRYSIRAAEAIAGQR